MRALQAQVEETVTQRKRLGVRGRGVREGVRCRKRKRERERGREGGIDDEGEKALMCESAKGRGGID